jgi:hypothetical protein
VEEHEQARRDIIITPATVQATASIGQPTVQVLRPGGIESQEAVGQATISVAGTGDRTVRDHEYGVRRD